MLRHRFVVDPRHFQVTFQLFFLSYGLVFLGWKTDIWHYIACIGGCLVFNYAAESTRCRKWLSFSTPSPAQPGWMGWGGSALISALSLCLLLKTNHWYISLLAAFFSILSKYLFRFNHKHIFNPSAFGIAATLLFTKEAWLSPGQWGNNTLLFFLIVTLGTIVVTRVQKLDTSLAFLFAFTGLLFWRQVYVLGWPADYFMHSITNGGLLLFSFFMISDPKTSPNHPVARVLWAVSIAATAFYLATFKWMYNTPILVLVMAAPLVPLLDKLFSGYRFEWPEGAVPDNYKSNIRGMKTTKTTIAALAVLLAMVSHEATAFCGFYVSKADGTLKNKTSQVIIAHDGNHNVITMYNDFKGNLKDFAMVVPVPVVLQQKDIRVVNQQIFTTLNEYSQPRLVEYYDQNPCGPKYDDYKSFGAPGALNETVVIGYGARKKDLGVKIEAKYIVGEYDILILSAKESSGLETWLTQNGYKIPYGANEVLEPYIKSNLKFFVVKVNEEEKKKLPGNFLRPLQISFNSPRFMLPIRLGMANADGDQDMLVYAFSKKGRIECTNYRTVSLPTGKNIPLFIKNNFSGFYSNLFQHQWKMEGRAVTMLEYAWDVSPQNFMKCDPCVATAPSVQDLAQAGVWWINRNGGDPSNTDEDDDNSYSPHVFFTRLHVRYNRKTFPQDLAFQETGNKENYQARYIITHPAEGGLDCAEGKKYLQDLKERRKDELEMLTYLTGKGYNDWDIITRAGEEKALPREDTYAAIASTLSPPASNRGNGIVFVTLGAMGLLSVAGIGRRKVKTK
jgi:hypothetical protein